MSLPFLDDSVCLRTAYFASIRHRPSWSALAGYFPGWIRSTALQGRIDEIVLESARLPDGRASAVATGRVPGTGSSIAAQTVLWWMIGHPQAGPAGLSGRRLCFCSTWQFLLEGASTLRSDPTPSMKYVQLLRSEQARPVRSITGFSDVIQNKMPRSMIEKSGRMPYA